MGPFSQDYGTCYFIELTVCDLEDQDSSLGWFSLSDVNKCSAHNIKGVFGISTFP